MKRFEMDIFEEMDAIIDDFFTSWDQIVTYEESEEEPEEEEEEEEEEEGEEFDAFESLTPWERHALLSDFLAGMY